MGKCSTTYTEMRFLIEPELTQVYVAIQADGDCPLGVQGWHHKTFPPSLNLQQIMKLWEDRTEDPVLWPQKAPPDQWRDAMRLIGTDPRLSPDDFDRDALKKVSLF